MSDFPQSGPATFRDLQRATGIPRDRLYAAVKAGEVPARFIGGKVYSRFEWIHQWMATGTWNPNEISDQPTSPFIRRAS